MEKKYDEELETKKMIVKALKGKYSKRLLEQFEKSPNGTAYFEGDWPLACVKSTYHLLEKTLVYEPQLTKRLRSFIDPNYFNEKDQKNWVEKTYPNSDVKDIEFDDSNILDYPFHAIFFTSDDKESDLFYSDPLYVIISTNISTPKLFRVVVQGAMGENGEYFYQSLYSGTISCDEGDYMIETNDDGETWHNVETSQDIEDEDEQNTIAKGICPKCGGKLSYYPTFEW